MHPSPALNKKAAIRKWTEKKGGNREMGGMEKRGREG